jgi:hypothetical protein
LITRPVKFARPKLFAAVLASVVAVPLVAQSNAAEQRATSSCTLTVPTKVAISSPYMNPVMQLGGDCTAAGVTEAKWEARRADGVLMYQTFFNARKPEKWHLFDKSSLAPWIWQPAGATGVGDLTVSRPDELSRSASPEDARSSAIAASIPQNTPTTDIRMASTVEMVTVADKAQVWARRYAITPHGFINYGGRTGSVQQLNRASGGWFVLKNFTTDSTGRWTMDNIDNAVGEPGDEISLRLVIYDDQYIFGSISPTYIGTICGDAGCPSTTTSGQTIRGLGNVRTESNLEAPGPLLDAPAGR